MKKIKEIFAYREMIRMLVKRNLRGRYKGSVLGFAWTFINPIFLLAVYTLVFSVILKSDIEKYYLFLFVALIPWIAFSGALTDGAVCVLTEKGLVTKIYFPRQILPLVVTLNNFVNMLLCFIIVIAVCWLDVGINPAALLYLIPVILVEFILALGLSFIVSSVTVYFRDLQHILGILLIAWQFMTPILYSMEMVPENLQKFFYFNPMTSVIIAYRDILYYKTAPELGTLTMALGMGLVFLAGGWLIFAKLEKRFAEVL